MSGWLLLYQVYAHLSTVQCVVDDFMLSQSSTCACVHACVFMCGTWCNVSVCVIAEDEMYAQLWKEDMLAKAKREEMEAVLQIERNREMLKVGILIHYIAYDG